MLLFLRKIRQKLVSENKVKSYLLYAIGEIVLVVVGIMIAVSLNNQNSERNESQLVKGYLLKIRQNMPNELESRISFRENIERIVEGNRKSLKIMDSGISSKYDSLKYYLGYTATAWSDDYQNVSINELVSRQLIDKVEDDSVRIFIKQYMRMHDRKEILNDYTLTQYHNLIEPQLIKYLNYSEIALDKYKVNLIMGGPESDFEGFAMDRDSWNVVSLKLELESTRLDYCNAAISFLDRFNGYLDKLDLE